MTKEEKEIIDKLKKEDIENIQETMSDTFYLLSIEELKTVLNLIEKQQKEIKELKKEIKDWKFTAKYVDENYIAKDEIKEIVDIYDNSKTELVLLPDGKEICLSDCDELIEYLRTLLEE